MARPRYAGVWVGQKSGLSTTYKRDLAAAKKAAAKVAMRKPGLVTVRDTHDDNRVLYEKSTIVRKNPLPIGRLVKVRLKRMRNGTIQIYKA